MKTNISSKVAAACRAHKPNKALRPSFCGAPRGGASIESTREMNAELPPGVIRLNPFRLSTITISEQAYFDLACFALRYAMGGGSIGRECIIGDIINSVGISDLGVRIADVFCRDYEDYIKQFPDAKCEKNRDSKWHRAYAWFRALRDDTFALLHYEGKDCEGRRLKEDYLCFQCDGEWHDATFFVLNASASCRPYPARIKSIEENYGWRRYVAEQIKKLEEQEACTAKRKARKEMK